MWRELLKIVASIFLSVFFLVAVLFFIFKVYACIDMSRGAPYNPYTDFDDWISYKIGCRDFGRWITAVVTPPLFGYFLYVLWKRKPEAEDSQDYIG